MSSLNNLNKYKILITYTPNIDNSLRYHNKLTSLINKDTFITAITDFEGDFTNPEKTYLYNQITIVLNELLSPTVVDDTTILLNIQKINYLTEDTTLVLLDNKLETISIFHNTLFNLLPV
jgi:hypothetical protein